MIDAEPDIVSEGDERYKGEPYPEPSKPKRQRKTRAKVDAVNSEQEGEVADKPLFREGTKRDIAYKALDREHGCTIAEGEELLGWKKPVVLSQFYECAKISKRKLEVVQEDGDAVYRLV